MHIFVSDCRSFEVSKKSDQDFIRSSSMRKRFTNAVSSFTSRLPFSWSSSDILMFFNTNSKSWSEYCFFSKLLVCMHTFCIYICCQRVKLLRVEKASPCRNSCWYHWKEIGQKDHPWFHRVSFLLYMYFSLMMNCLTCHDQVGRFSASTRIL